MREDLQGWFDLLTDVASEASKRLGGLGPFTPREVAVLAAAPFLGVETMILLGFEEKDLPARSTLRKVGELIRRLEDSG